MLKYNQFKSFDENEIAKETTINESQRVINHPQDIQSQLVDTMNTQPEGEMIFEGELHGAVYYSFV